MSDDWMDELRATDGALQPTAAARGEILEGVRRATRRRAAGVSAAAVMSVAVVAVGFAVVPGLAGPWADGEPERPVPVGSGTTEPTSDPELFDCPSQSKVFDPEAAPPIENLDEQQAIIGRLENTTFKAFAVHRAEPTPIGVGVLVVTDDVPGARDYLTREFGVALVGGWNPDAPAPGFGIDLHTSIDQMLGWELGDSAHWVRLNYRGSDGYASIALWRTAGAVLLQWKEPVPPEIQSLAGPRPNGVDVVIEGVRYSAHDFRQASDRVIEAIRSGRVDADWSSASACGDHSGLEVGITPESLGERRAELQDELSEIAGMPVRVRPEEGPIPLGGPVQVPEEAEPER